MKVTTSQDKYLNIVSAFLLLVAFAFFVASFSGHYWATSNDSSSLDLKFGIWTTCFFDDEILDNRCKSTDSYVIDGKYFPN